MIVQATIVTPPKPAPKPKPPKRIWDNYEVIGEVQKSGRIKFVVAAAMRDGVRYINIREFYCRKKDGEWRPGRDGITIPLLIPIDQGTKFLFPYKELMAVLRSTAEHLQTMPLADETKAIYREEKI